MIMNSTVHENHFDADPLICTKERQINSIGYLQQGVNHRCYMHIYRYIHMHNENIIGQEHPEAQKDAG